MPLRASFGAILVVCMLPAIVVGQPQRGPECVQHPTTDVILPLRYPFDTHRSVALFRFHRQQEARRELDGARATARGPWRWRIAPDRRDDVIEALDALRTCLATTTPPPLATLTIRVQGPSRDDGTAGAARRDARVYVEGIQVGRTGADGKLTARVPSGAILVSAEIPINEAGSTDITLHPGASESVVITVHDGKEISEPTQLVLTELQDDILPADTRSLTLKFMRGDQLAPVTHIDEVNAEDRESRTYHRLDGLFTIVRGEIVATDVARMFEALSPQYEETIYLSVQAMAGDHEMHYGTIAFRVGRSALSVRLAAPPSNPGLATSGIDVGISLIGAGIAVQRTSDRNGRLVVESLPHGTVALECITVVKGKYYYGRAVLAHDARRSVTLVLLHVEDLKNGVSPLRVEVASEKERPPDRSIAAAPPVEKIVARILVSSAETARSVSGTTTLAAPRGSRRLMLAYDIGSLEERRNPRFDDVWTLSVFDQNGRSLLHIMRNVLSQYRVNPHWQPGGRSGRVQEFFDIGAAAETTDVHFTVAATTVNIGDDQHRTWVEALIRTVDERWPASRRD